MNKYSTHLDIAALMASEIESIDERLFSVDTLKQGIKFFGISILGGAIGFAALIGGMHLASFINYLLA